MVEEATLLADDIDNNAVQERTYHEAQVVLRVLDGKGSSPLAELVPEDTSTECRELSQSLQEALSCRITMYLGQFRDDRLYVRRATRIMITTKTMNGESEEAGTEVILCIKRALEREESPTQLLQKIEEAKSGALYELLNVSKDSVKVCELVQAREVVRERPTLVQLRAETEELQAACQLRYEQSQAIKPYHKQQLRTWHRLKGALTYIRKMDMGNVVQEARKSSLKAAPPPADDVAVDQNSNDGFAHQWLGVRDILKSKLSVLKAVSERDERKRVRGELVRCEGRLQLLNHLQQGCMQWPPICIEVGGQEIKADRRWNQGLAEPEFTLNGVEPSTVDEERHCGRFCYYCASLTPPVRVQHRLVDCSKRKKANGREYQPACMAEARAELAKQRRVCEEKLAVHRKATEAVRVQKQALLELAGAIKVLGTQEAHKPPPPPPPPPPDGERIRSYREFLRRRMHQSTMVMKLLARGSKQPSALETAPSHWAELKAVALMQPHPRVIAGPITPVWIYQTAATLDLDLSERGPDHGMLPFVVAVARAPLPVHWHAVRDPAAEQAPGPSAAAGRGTLAWYAPPPGAEVAYRDVPPPSAAQLDREAPPSLLSTRGSSAATTAPARLSLDSLGSASSDGEGAGKGLVDVDKSSAYARAMEKKRLDEAANAPPPPPPKAIEKARTSRRLSSGERVQRTEEELKRWESQLYRLRKLDVYEHVHSGERRNGHPGAALLRPTVAGMQTKMGRTTKPNVLSSWVQLADFDGHVYFFSFTSYVREERFPALEARDVPACYFPLRKLEPSAQLLADAGEALVHEMAPSLGDYERAVGSLRTMLYESRKAARALVLAHTPCPLDEMVYAAQYLGLNAATDRDLMWIIDVMLTPELPVGWLRKSTVEGTEYYWNALLGAAQWEHPQVSFLTGVASGLRELRQREATAAAEREAATSFKREKEEAEAQKAADAPPRRDSMQAKRASSFNAPSAAKPF